MKKLLIIAIITLAAILARSATQTPESGKNAYYVSWFYSNPDNSQGYKSLTIANQPELSASFIWGLERYIRTNVSSRAENVTILNIIPIKSSAD